MRRFAVYIQRLLHLWWLVVLTVGVAGAATGLTDLLAPRAYTATMRLALRPAPGLPPSTGDPTRAIEVIDQTFVANTVVQAMTRPPTYEQAAAQAGLPAGTVDEYTIDVTVDAASSTITVASTGPHAATAAAYVNSLGRLATQATTRLYRMFTLEVVQPARPPAGPSHPDPARDLPVALSLSLVLGLFLAVFYDYLAH